MSVLRGLVLALVIVTVANLIRMAVLYVTDDRQTADLVLVAALCFAIGGLSMVVAS